MTDLERRALLGDKQAQEELTELRIPLRCPLCGNPVVMMEVEPHSEKMGWIEYTYDGGAFLTCSCGYAISGKNKEDVLRKHNTRPAPPLGRCKDCANTTPGEDVLNHKDVIVCTVYGCRVEEDGSCKEFEPKGENGNGIHRD